MWARRKLKCSGKIKVKGATVRLATGKKLRDEERGRKQLNVRSR